MHSAHNSGRKPCSSPIFRNADSKEKAALRAAEPLVVGFSCEVEAQPGDFAVALDEELAHTPGDEVFVNLDFYRFMLPCAFDGEACFDVYVHDVLLVSC